MKNIKRIFKENARQLSIACYTLLAISYTLSAAYAAEVVARPTATTVATSARGRPATTVATPRAASATAVAVVPAESAPAAVEVSTEPAAPAVEDKSSQFGATFAKAGGTAADSSDESDVKRQIDQLRRADAAAETVATAKKSLGAANTAVLCDSDLRKCMSEKCPGTMPPNADGTTTFTFEKCATDNSVSWGQKLDQCQRASKCTAQEFAILAPEITADRDSFATMGGFRNVMTCGADYNKCITDGCGTTLDSCLNKAVSDGVIAGCKDKADACKSDDSGLSARVVQVFGMMRTGAGNRVAAMEKELGGMRDKMPNQCKSIGALFDARSFSCLFTVNFFADGDSNPKATRTVRAGDTFDCTQEWFGVDVTTVLENILRRDRELQGASGAMLGGGIGTGVGALANNLINKGGDLNAKDTKTESDKKDADLAVKGECDNQGGVMIGSKCQTRMSQDVCKARKGKWTKDKAGNSCEINGTTIKEGAEDTGASLVDKSPTPPVDPSSSNNQAPTLGNDPSPGQSAGDPGPDTGNKDGNSFSAGNLPSGNSNNDRADKLKKDQEDFEKDNCKKKGKQWDYTLNKCSIKDLGSGENSTLPTSIPKPALPSGIGNTTRTNGLGQQNKGLLSGNNNYGNTNLGTGNTGIGNTSGGTSSGNNVSGTGNAASGTGNGTK